MLENPPTTHIYNMESGLSVRKGSVAFQQPCIALTFGYCDGPDSPV
jgi:hypothetical protein